MLEITIVAVGRVKERYIAEGVEEFSRRLRSYARLRQIEVHDEPLHGSTANAMLSLSKEGERILRALPEHALVIALDRSGEEWSSEELAARIRGWELQGENRLAFIVGGELGLSPQVLASSDHVLSLSRMTFTYQLARLLLLEQLYRAFRINRGEPYHR